MFANLTTRPRGGRAANERDELASPHVEFPRLAVSACRPVSVIFKRTTSTVRPPAIMRSTFAIARPAMHRSTSSSQPVARCPYRIVAKLPRRSALPVASAHTLTLKVGSIHAQASLPHRIWCRNPQRQKVTRPKGRHFQWLSSEKSLGSKSEQ
jgi:hypothetical protein